MGDEGCFSKSSSELRRYETKSPAAITEIAASVADIDSMDRPVIRIPLPGRRIILSSPRGNRERGRYAHTRSCPFRNSCATIVGSQRRAATVNVVIVEGIA